MMALHNLLWSVPLKIGAFAKLGLFFPMVCIIHVLDKTSAEQLYRDKGLFLLSSSAHLFSFPGNYRLVQLSCSW